MYSRFYCIYFNDNIYLSVFVENVDKGHICELELDETKVRKFKDAIENSYWFEFFMGMHKLYFMGI